MTDRLRDAAQAVVDAWDAQVSHGKLRRWVDVLRAALAEQEAEPVAWIDDSGHPKHIKYLQSATEHRLYGSLRPLYTHPPRREWVPLTDEERRACTQSPFTEENYRAIEAALKRKNHG